MRSPFRVTDDVVVDIEWSGISTGTERLLYTGQMPSFPGMGYPLVPGYESVGRISEAGSASGAKVGDRVFVPGARCFGDIRGLFGGAAARVVVPAARVTPVDDDLGDDAVLLALAATASHAMAAHGAVLPDLIVGHGVLGRLLARLTVAAGGEAPTVWESDPLRRDGGNGYAVIDPTTDRRRDYGSIYDVSGNAGLLDSLVQHLRPGGEIVLAGFLRPAPVAVVSPRLHARGAVPRGGRMAPARSPEDHRPDPVGPTQPRRADHPPLPGPLGGVGLSHRLLRPVLPQDDSRLERVLMNAVPRFTLTQSLRAEAAIEPDPVVTAAPKKQTQVIAIYGKGGIGKSFTLANLSYMMAQQGKRVLLIGCDPKSDTTSLLFGGRSCLHDHRDLLEEETGGRGREDRRRLLQAGTASSPWSSADRRSAAAAAAAASSTGFELLEKLGFHEWGFDYVLLDFLGDVVCGGFGLPIARDMCQKVIVVGSNDLQSLYVANNVCSAVDYFRKMGGNVGVAGLVINKDDGTGEAQAFAEAVGIPVLAAIPANEDIRRKSANYEIIGQPGGVWAPLFEALGEQVAAAPPRPSGAAVARSAARPVQGRCGRARRGAGAGHHGRHVRRSRGREAVPRSHLRRCVRPRA